MKTAEEILKDKTTKAYGEKVVVYDVAIQAMNEFAEQFLFDFTLWAAKNKFKRTSGNLWHKEPADRVYTIKQMLELYKKDHE